MPSSLRGDLGAAVSSSGGRGENDGGAGLCRGEPTGGVGTSDGGSGRRTKRGEEPLLDNRRPSGTGTSEGGSGRRVMQGEEPSAALSSLRPILGDEDELDNRLDSSDESADCHPVDTRRGSPGTMERSDGRRRGDSDGFFGSGGGGPVGRTLLQSQNSFLLESTSSVCSSYMTFSLADGRRGGMGGGPRAGRSFASFCSGVSLATELMAETTCGGGGGGRRGDFAETVLFMSSSTTSSSVSRRSSSRLEES
jgi:hypothetical protein